MHDSKGVLRTRELPTNCIKFVLIFNFFHNFLKKIECFGRNQNLSYHVTLALFVNHENTFKHT